jgi:hypothetical protein
MTSAGPEAENRQARMALDIGGCRISFQRFARPASQLIHRVPSSLGALPLGDSSSETLLPLADNEAFWIGIESPDRPLELEIVIQIVRPDGTTQLVRPEARSSIAMVAGFSRDDGSLECFTLQTVREVILRSRTHDARVCIVEPDLYSLRTGLPKPAPLDPSAAYDGSLLP